jgi:outer membrane protein TolC
MKRADFKPLLLGLLAPALTACAVGPDYKRPDAPVAPAYKEAGDWLSATPSDDAQRGAWWEAFNDPQLNELEKQVIVSNQT